MKKAFTLIELVFVIIIIGIIAVFTSSRFSRDGISIATDQILNHIRYTQSLALNQDMLVPLPQLSSETNINAANKDSRQWFKKWWQFYISGNGESYAVFSDSATSSNTNYEFDASPYFPDIIAKDPSTGLYIYGGWSGNSAPDESEKMPAVNVSREFSVSLRMTGCSGQHILFDRLGRPNCSKTSTGGGDAGAYPYTHLSTSGMCIEISDEFNSNTVRVTAVTGYSFITRNDTCP